MVPLGFEPEGVPVLALTLAPTPTSIPYLIFKYLLRLGTPFLALGNYQE